MNHKILLLHDALNSGGAERQICYLAIYLKKIGCDVKLCIFYNENFYTDFLYEGGVEAIVYPEGQNIMHRPRVITRIVRMWRPDLVISYNRGSSISAALVRHWVGGFRLVVSERNTTQRLSLADRIKFFAYHWADYVVPNSYAQGRYIRQHFKALSSKVRVITNMVDVDLFQPAASYGENETVTTVITVARVMPQKNVLRFLEALHQLKQQDVKARFVWYGNTQGSAAYWAEVQALQHALGLNDYITFYPPQPNIEVAYRKASIFCLPSTYEGFPNTLVEAMSCGLPVACSRVCDNPDIVSEGQNGVMFNPIDVADMAHKLSSLINLPQDQRRAIGRANRKKVEHLCAPLSFVEHYLDLL